MCVFIHAGVNVCLPVKGQIRQNSNHHIMPLILACVFRNRVGFGLNIPVVLCRGQDLEQQSGPVRKTGEELVKEQHLI